MTRSFSSTSNATSAAGNVRHLKDLLPEFRAADNTFWKWKQQLELLRNSYRLDDNSARVLISSRLKGRALAWFHSKAEHLTLSVENLLEEMTRMFDSRPAKLSLRKEFEARVWKADEHIVDMRLQNQARVMNFQSKTDLLKAFEKVNPVIKRFNDLKLRRDGLKSSDAKTETSSAKGKSTKCYKCQERGHIATHCKRVVMLGIY
ncbi:hypothetical protein ALC62_06832 [Cyphomyrmex costatus]|uniref:CCHC-type domain-containing protein n=1 Tax=Cyphomyrmex costatus TaxID=456900 RepID=A0A151IIH1_9HYME|nr:hypothetical protein ALC62_06832 [Cyphomyrmex costatus]